MANEYSSPVCIYKFNTLSGSLQELTIDNFMKEKWDMSDMNQWLSNFCIFCSSNYFAKEKGKLIQKGGDRGRNVILTVNIKLLFFQEVYIINHMHL